MTAETDKPAAPPAAEEPALKKQKVAPEAPTAKENSTEAKENVEMKEAPVKPTEVEGNTEKAADGEKEPAVAADKSELPGWPDHKLNINLGLMKDSEGMRFSEVATSKCDILQGIGEKSVQVCENFGVNTVADLAEYKYYKIAKAIAALAPLEEKDARTASSVMNIDTAVDAKYETMTFAEILEAPVSALQGLSEATATLLEELKVKTVKDLSTFKYCAWSEAIVTLSQYENKLSASERRAAKMLKRLE